MLFFWKGCVSRQRRKGCTRGERNGWRRILDGVRREVSRGDLEVFLVVVFKGWLFGGRIF